MDPIDDLKVALIKITKIRHEHGEKEFRDLMASLGASPRNQKHASEIVRSFDEVTGKFIRPYKRIFKIIGKENNIRDKFRRRVLNFKPAQKGRWGGLKQYASELRQERDVIAGQLKQYSHLYPKRLKLKGSKKELFENIEKDIPTCFREEVTHVIRPSYKKLATEWMARYYPCTATTLDQMIRESKK